MAKCSTVRIYPVGSVKNKQWKCSIEKHPHDRVKRKTIPNTLGFFHYFDDISDEQALELLKNKMIEAHQQEIETLQKSLESLKKVKLTKTS